ncbi:MAG: hypothetical protein BWX80_04184 [Candidatus Hydrogenedentes bacterium ADurb.Bin101]|nr:MAG: hypothetical protein BWX80_04231 [Candidatus Hydrogenedentes bacterium ADurb.Bin101]OQB96489.1 MAG: hypothetical protein BWX80_04184 [Candidatus Hydrogenedentes bacterium ADurb.Bin101]
MAEERVVIRHVCRTFKIVIIFRMHVEQGQRERTVPAHQRGNGHAKAGKRHLRLTHVARELPHGLLHIKSGK